MGSTTNYHSVMAVDHNRNMTKEGATTTTAESSTAAAAAGGGSGSNKPDLWARITNHLPFLRTKRGIAVAVIAILVIIGGGLAGLASLRNQSNDDVDLGGAADGGSGTLNPNAITDDAYFYGQSPPVYPSRGFLFLLLSNYEWTADILRAVHT